jgi:hypothetical protein
MEKNINEKTTYSEIYKKNKIEKMKLITIKILCPHKII